MHALIVIGVIVAGLIYVVGAFTSGADLEKNGKSLAEYREKYGKDLGMLICCTYRGAVIFAWPLVFGLGFVVGLVRDVYKLVFGK